MRYTTPRGFTLLEVVVASLLMSLILLVIFAVFRMGSSSLLKANAQTDLLQNLQVASNKVARDIEGSVYESVSVTSDQSAVGFLSAASDVYGGDYAVAADGSLRWQKYVIYYHVPGTRELSLVEVPLAAGSPEESSPGPIESYGPSEPLNVYATGGKVIARNIYDCRFTLEDRILVMELSGRRRRPGRQDEERLEARSAVRLRN